MFGRKLAVAGIAAFALTPGVALACMGGGNAHAPVSSGITGGTGATGVTGSTGSTGSTDSRDAANRSNTTSTSGNRRHHFRHGHQFHGGDFASRS
jgi:hypothetical protein